MKNILKRCHPVTSLIYFMVVIAFSMFVMNPLFLLISFTTSLIYSVILSANKGVLFCFKFVLPVFLIMMIANCFFGSTGATVLFSFYSVDISLESIVFSVTSALLLVTTVLWFYCLNCVISSDKFIYIFGNIIPSFALVLSMTVRFIPLFIKRFKNTYNVQCLLNTDKKKAVFPVIISMVKWSLENSVTTSDSMKNRGYGTCKRTSYPSFTFTFLDVSLLFLFFVLLIFMFSGVFLNTYNVTFFPTVQFAKLNFYVVFAYGMFCFLPVIFFIFEEVKWKFYQHKI